MRTRIFIRQNKKDNDRRSTMTFGNKKTIVLLTAQTKSTKIPQITALGRSAANLPKLPPFFPVFSEL